VKSQKGTLIAFLRTALGLVAPAGGVRAQGPARDVIAGPQPGVDCVDRIDFGAMSG
jgi:hypothetical protein